MLVIGDGKLSATSVDHFLLDLAVPDLDADPSGELVLDQLLEHSRVLLGTVAGSISLVDTTLGRYHKLAEQGVACRLGMSFPLDEGATGQAVSRRMPVVIDDYGDLRAGHLPPDHPVSRGAAAAVPLWWRGEVIGVNVAFAGRPRTFTATEMDAFELLTQRVAAAVVRAGSVVRTLVGRLREYDRVVGPEIGVQTVVTEVGPPRPVPDGVVSAADLVALVGRAVSMRGRPSRMHVAVVNRPGGLRLLVQDESAEALPPSADPLGLGTSTWNELLAIIGGGLGGQIGVEHVAGWGMLLTADFPDGGPPADPSPLTRREQQVLGLLADGLTDREVAVRLVISPKTVEKHVGAVLRKTVAPTRTAAVAQAMGRGWLLPERAGGRTDLVGRR